MRAVLLISMTRFQRFLVAASLLFAGANFAAEDTPHRARDTKTAAAAGAIVPGYDNGAAIEAMPHCTARIEGRSPCSVRFLTLRGRHFSIGSPGSTAEVSRFLATLKDGRVYSLPEAFLDFKRRE
jgi:hypothetical protein